MKIALISNFPPKTGSGKYSFELFKALKGQKVDCEYILCDNEKVKDTRNIDGINFPIFNKTLNSFYVYPKRIPDIYDIYHATNQFMVNISQYKNPAVITILDLIMLLDRKSSPFITRFLQARNIFRNISKYKKIIAISNYTKKDIVSILKIPEERVAVTHLGINNEIFTAGDKETSRNLLNLPTNKKLILHVGSEESRKNVSTLIKSFYIIKKEMSDAILIRVGSQSQESRNLIKKLNLTKDVQYFNNIEENELVNFYRSADVFVFPSTYEGFGIPPLEAMASGCPVVSSTKTSLGEILNDGAVKLNDPLDAKEMTNKVINVLTEDNSTLIKAGIKNSKMFTWDKCAKNTKKIYNEIL